MKNILNGILLPLASIMMISCETEYTPDTSKYPVEYVVEGFVEYTANNTPTYVVLSRTLPFFDRIDGDAISNAFVRGAAVSVSTDGGVPVTLTEICLEEIDPTVADQLRDILVVNGAFTNLCFYIDLANQIIEKPGSTYDLLIETGEDRITATTTIPDSVPAINVYHKVPAGNVAAGLFDVELEFVDPANQEDYYRVLSGVNDRPLYGNNGSVFDDVFIDADTVAFPVPRPTYPDEDPEITQVGLYSAGDTVNLKWMTLDAAHYEFWSSLEFDSNNGGPFANYTRANSNVNGALGIWGGYSAYYYQYIIPE